MVTSLMQLGVLCFISLTEAMLLVIGRKENMTKFGNIWTLNFLMSQRLQMPFSKCTIRM